MAKNWFLVAFPYFKQKISLKSTILISQKTMSIKNKSQYVIDVDGAGLKRRTSIFWLKIGEKRFKKWNLFKSIYMFFINAYRIKLFHLKIHNGVK